MAHAHLPRAGWAPARHVAAGVHHHQYHYRLDEACAAHHLTPSLSVLSALSAPQHRRGSAASADKSPSSDSPSFPAQCRQCHKEAPRTGSPAHSQVLAGSWPGGKTDMLGGLHTNSRYMPRFLAAAVRNSVNPVSACSKPRRAAGGSLDSRSIAVYIYFRAASYMRKGSDIVQKRAENPRKPSDPPRPLKAAAWTQPRFRSGSQFKYPRGNRNGNTKNDFSYYINRVSLLFTLPRTYFEKSPNEQYFKFSHLNISSTRNYSEK